MTNLPIPVEALEDAGIVLGRRGAGKSNVLMVLFEHELDAGHRSVMIDPKGDRWGVRLNPDKSASRFDVPIFGGDHGDYAVDEDMGERLGRLVAEHDLSCLIDLSLLSLHGKQRFMMGFAPTLLQRNRAPLTLFLEEVDQFANQDPRYQPAMLVHHIANFATLGRQRGIVPWVASQRPAKVNATVRSQADTFIGMKVTSPLDREAYRDWFKGHGKEAAARVEEEAGRLQPGEALVWAGANEFFDRIQFPMASTYDSGRTPKHGETIDAVKLPKLSNTAIIDLLATPEPDEEAKDSPAARVSDEDLKLHPGFVAMREDRDAFERRAHDAEAERDELRRTNDIMERQISAIRDVLAANDTHKPAPPPAATPETARQSPPAREKLVAVPKPPRPAPSDGSITGPQQRILDALAWWEAFGIDAPTNEQIGFVAGYSPGSGNFNNLRGQLRAAGMIDYPAGGRVSLTEEGRVAANRPDTPPTRGAFHAAVRAKLKPPQLRLLDPALGAYPKDVSVDDLAAVSGYSAGSGNFNNLRGSLRTLDLIVYPRPGHVRASDWLFP